MSQKVFSALIVDDHPLFRKGMKELLEKSTEYKNCVEAESTAGALESFATHNPDLVTVDISLGGENGLHLVAALRQLDERVPILVVSMHREEFYSRRTKENGGSGYVCKQEPPEEILKAVRDVREGMPRFNASRSDAGGTSNAPQSEIIKSLSGREMQILRFLGEAMTTQSIANNLGVAATTVETYRERIKAKLKLNNSAALSRFAILWRLENP